MNQRLKYKRMTKIVDKNGTLFLISFNWQGLFRLRDRSQHSEKKRLVLVNI